MSSTVLRRFVLHASLFAAAALALSSPAVARAEGARPPAGSAEPVARVDSADAETIHPPFGSLTLKKLDGSKASLSALRGKLVLLNFWATWCKPCVGEMPLLAGLARKYQDRGLVVVAASVDDPSEQEAVERFAGQLPEGMEIWVGATQEDMARLKMGSALPATVLIDREGRVLGARQGAITEGLLDEDIEQALDGKDDEAPRPKKQRPLSGATEAAASLPPPPVL